MGLIRTVAPGPLFTAQQIRDWLRLDDDAEDATLVRLAAVGVEELDGSDGWLGRALRPQTWTLILDGFPCSGWIRIPMPPLIGVDEIAYVDAAGADQVLAPAIYQVVGQGGSQPAHIELRDGQAWPDTARRSETVTITFRCGYAETGTGDDVVITVPASIQQAVLEMVANMFSNRGEGCGEAFDKMMDGTTGPKLSKYQIHWFA